MEFFIDNKIRDDIIILMVDGMCFCVFLECVKIVNLKNKYGYF